jgi:hypothetical protein
MLKKEKNIRAAALKGNYYIDTFPGLKFIMVNKITINLNFDT